MALGKPPGPAFMGSEALEASNLLPGLDELGCVGACVRDSVASTYNGG